MFSVSDIKETVYPAAYRRGKELYETAGVFDFSYELYLVDELPVADVRAKVRGINQEYYSHYRRGVRGCDELQLRM